MPIMNKLTDKNDGKTNLHSANDISIDQSSWHFFSSNFICRILLIAITIFMLFQVLIRCVFSISITWVEEIIKFLFAWFCLLSAAMAMKYKAHIAIDFFVDFFPDSIQKAIKNFSQFVVLGILALLVINSIRMTIAVHSQTSLVLGIPMSIPYASLPASCILMFIYQSIHILSLFKKGNFK
jgi:TRAP-type C4-dicarboxylate transport system permease small subunit